MSERDYINGIPFVLGQRFYPLPRTQFRQVDIHIPLDALQDEFDFSFERSTLRSSAAYFEEKQRLAQEAEERRQRAEAERLAAAEAAEAEAQARAALKASQEAESVVTEGSYDGKDEEDEKDESSTASSSDPVDLTVATLSHPPTPLSQSYTTVANGVGHMLQHHHPRFVYQIPSYPLPQQPQLQVNMCHLVEPPILKPQIPKASSAPRLTENAVGQPKLNLSDFEAAAASPFDSVALTSLDDRSELEQVWANNMNLSVASGSLPTPQTSQAFIPDGESLSQMYSSFQASNVNGGSHLSQISTSASPTATATVISSPYYATQPHQQHGPIPGVQQPQSTAVTAYGPLQWSGYYGNTATQATPTSGAGTVPSTTSDSFTRVQFPFLSSLTQNNNRILLRQQNRLAERQYHQQQHQLQQQYYPPHSQPTYSPNATVLASAPLITSHVHSSQPVPHPSDIQTNSNPVPGSSSNPRPLLRHPVPNYWHPGMATQRFHEQR